MYALKTLTGSLIVALALSTAAHAEGAADTRNLTAKQVEVVNAVTADRSIKVDAWLDRADGLYQDKEAVSVQVRLDTAAYVTLINVNAKGEANVIFPNQFVTNNYLSANVTHAIPGAGATYKLEVSPPYGGNVLKVIASSSPTPVFSRAELGTTGPFPAVTGGVDALLGRLGKTITAVAAPAAPAQPATAAPAVRQGHAEKVWAVVPSRTGQAPIAQPTAPQVVTTTTTTTTTTVSDASAPVAAPAVSPTLPATVSRSDFGLVLEADKTSYTQGNRIQVRATSEKNCSLVLLDVAPDGSYTVLLPNAVSGDTWLSAGKTAFLASADSKLDLTAGVVGGHALVGICSARRTLGQFLFGRTDGRTSATVRPPSLEEVLAKQPQGDVARTHLNYVVTP